MSILAVWVAKCENPASPEASGASTGAGLGCSRSWLDDGKSEQLGLEVHPSAYTPHLDDKSGVLVLLAVDCLRAEAIKNGLTLMLRQLLEASVANLKLLGKPMLLECLLDDLSFDSLDDCPHTLFVSFIKLNINRCHAVLSNLLVCWMVE